MEKLNNTIVFKGNKYDVISDNRKLKSATGHGFVTLCSKEPIKDLGKVKIHDEFSLSADKQTLIEFGLLNDEPIADVTYSKVTTGKRPTIKYDNNNSSPRLDCSNLGLFLTKESNYSSPDSNESNCRNSKRRGKFKFNRPGFR
ncbi:hypothetical protein CVPH_0481 [Abyssogena phaseoliformis symbiont OG214]|uniref:hypothetical protein n=1 Tax=Abyssogena phaseoliformis symbiont TaxID=596095 RepID=UPI001916BEFC|nr:hypothetical protein [Abyssogena phaseoliformis symbiont]BBB22557.1 hypothetical protein CVPH_0481 [Abyssogena phaseoliformis symbiont OG214]